MNRVLKTTTPALDMIVSNLRAQIVTLHNTLETIERIHTVDEDYIYNSLKSVESEIRRIRNYISV